MGISEIFSGIKSSLTAIYSLKIEKEVQERLNELTGYLTAAQNLCLEMQERQSALLQEKIDLQERLRKIECWQTEKRRYELKEISPGFFAYEILHTARGNEPIHWLCATCFGKEQKAILRVNRNAENHIVGYDCPNCSNRFTVPCSFRVTSAPRFRRETY